MELYLVALAFVTGFGLPVAVIFASTAQGKATTAALESIGRQPESAARVQLALVIGLALIEALVIYSLLMFFLLLGKLPSVEDVLKLSETQASARATPAKVLVETASNTLDANGTASTTLTVHVFDQNNQPLKGQTIDMSADSGTITSPAKDNKDGSYTALYTASNQPGKIGIHATAINGVSGEITLTLQ
ncbi:MAG: invasin domain 3-containing protein [Candidatus Poribacteria bacterium]